MSRHEGRTAVITGAALGMGREHASRLASEGRGCRYPDWLARRVTVPRATVGTLPSHAQAGGALLLPSRGSRKGAGHAVYVSAAEELEGAGLERGVSVYSYASASGGSSERRLEDVRAPYRLYRATATDRWALDPPDGHPDHR